MAKTASKSFWSKYQKRYQATKSLLCVGLDPELSKLPDCVKMAANPIWEFNRAIIESTSPYACAFKPNLAFYLADGVRGLEALYKTVELIPEDIPVILDCKVGDIGSTMSAYVTAFFADLKVDAITLNPLMGSDVLKPLLDREPSFCLLPCASPPILLPLSFCRVLAWPKKLQIGCRISPLKSLAQWWELHEAANFMACVSFCPAEFYLSPVLELKGEILMLFYARPKIA